MLGRVGLVLLVLLSSVHAWPGMHGVKGANHPPPATATTSAVTASLDATVAVAVAAAVAPLDQLVAATTKGPVVGPTCTVGAHGWWPDVGPCPNTPKQPIPLVPPPQAPVRAAYQWPNDFSVDWTMYFVPDANDAPPYNPYPLTAFNVTKGRTWYHTVDASTEKRNMRETYDSFCIPVFGDPTSPMGAVNNYGCDFINRADTDTAYVILHADRPVGAPECCVIGQPFHAPPPTFSARMPVRWSTAANATYTPPVPQVDWTAVWDIDAGIFSYGWNVATQQPHAFYMMGVPWVASWLWQPFTNMTYGVPDPKVWDLPDACTNAGRCSGW